MGSGGNSRFQGAPFFLVIFAIMGHMDNVIHHEKLVVLDSQ